MICAVPLLVSCGGGGGSPNATASPISTVSTSTTNPITWTPGVFLPENTYRSQCTVTNENHFLRSFSNNTYLWYDEIVDRDPALFSTPDYFNLLKTQALTPSGNPKDNFHFSLPTAEWNAQSEAGVAVGYGAQFVVMQSTPPRLILVAYTEPGSPAAAPSVALRRGAQILTVDGVNVANGSNTGVLNAGLFPENVGETHTFSVRDPGGTIRTITMQSAAVTSTPVQNVSTFTIPGGKAGYMLFNDHIATAESGLYNAVTQLALAGVTELVLDIRYNGGGFLDLASQLAYMIAGPARTAGRAFEAIKFNNKHPLFDPITGATLTPVPFRNRSIGLDPVLPAGTLLPTLNLSRVYVLTGAGTCSASESIINGLRGVDVNVIQIGSTTCGKPYGFYPKDNCGTTYFTIQFLGVNAKGFGDYTDGFSPANATSNIGTVIPGCSVRDDFTAALGNPAEARLAAALNHIQTGACPAASGLSSPSLLRLAPVTTTDVEEVPKAAWQQNRIMRP
jgi:carboxyl-terminal processing protease